MRGSNTCQPIPSPLRAGWREAPGGGSSELDLSSQTPTPNPSPQGGGEPVASGEREAPETPEILFYVASRGHHEDIGGLTPGSMTPRATTIVEEGVYIDNVKLVD